MSNILPQLNADGLSTSAKVRLLIAQFGIATYMYVKIFEGRDFAGWLWDLFWVPVW